SSMTVLFPEHNYDDLEAAQFAVNELAPAETIIVARFDPYPSYIGMTLSQIAAQRQTDTAKTLIDLVAQARRAQTAPGQYNESIIATSMSEENVKTLLNWQHTNLCSDGYLTELH